MQRQANLVLFDLDNTLLDGDSDYEWGIFLCNHQLVDADEYRKQNAIFYSEYSSGNLDIHDYLRFVLKTFTQHSKEQLLEWRKQFVNEVIEPLISPANKALVSRHKENGDITVIITATNQFITEPIAEIFGVDDLIATELEIVNGQFTGHPQGTPCFKDGKVICFKQWLKRVRTQFRQLWFYSDSINDLPLLEYADKPIIKNGEADIVAIAKQRNWSVLR